MTHHQPRVLRLFARFVPGDLREPIAGDLHEEYLRIRARRGAARSALWLWWNAARVAMTFRWERAAHGRPLPPIGDELRGFSHMWDGLRQDIVFGARMLRRQPAFTAVALLALALGIGANTAIFSIVDAVLWRPLPYPSPNSLISLGEQRPRENRVHGPVAPADFYDWRRDNRTFSAIAAIEPLSINISGDAEPERIRGIIVTPGFLDVVGIKPALGRDFTSDEETEGRHQVVMLTDGFWRRRFGGDRSVVGRAISLNGNTYDVIGILPAEFRWASQPDILIPYVLATGDPISLRANHSMDVVGRLKPGVSIEQARTDLDAIGKRLSEQFPRTNAAHFPHLFTLQASMVGDVRPALLVLLGAVGLVLLTACVNVAMLLLARATSREREIAVRLAIGAGRGRLVRQLLTESVLLATVGGAAGVLVAAWSLAALRTLLPASLRLLPGIGQVGLDVRILTFALGLSVVTGVVFGMIPAFTAADQRLASTLHEEGRSGSTSARSTRMRAVLVVAELALSLVLLVGAGLLLVSFKRVLDVSPGFEPENLILAPIVRSTPRPQTLTFYEQLLERVRAIPSVEAAALGTPSPLSVPDGRSGFGIEGRTGQSPIPVRARPRIITPGYFATLGIPLIGGRNFTDRDAEGTPDVVILNAAAVRRYWPNENPLGRRITFFSNDRWLEIVGIVGDVKHAGLDQDTDPEAYLSYRQTHFAFMGQRLNLIIRTHAPVAAIAPMLRTVVTEIDRNQPIGAVSAMEDVIAESVAPRRLNLWLVAGFAGVALLLTASGLYGVMSYLVAQRTREIGVRMALGATPSSVLKLVLRQAGAMTLTGIAIGVIGALALTRFLSALLFGVTSKDPLVYASVAMMLGVVALLAAAIPSSRATKVDPISALR